VRDGRIIVKLHLHEIANASSKFMTTPLLSICVPTYNRPDRLRVMLQAILPQVADCSDKVELWISDNASTDDTAQVVEESKRLGPFRYSRNATNIGLISNLIRCATELAQGEFVWLLGDDDLLCPNALSRIVSALEVNRGLELINLNFQHASFAESWPENAVGGYDGAAYGVVNPDLSDHPVSRWYELISPENSMCGQMYTHVIRRSVWQDYWHGRPRQRDFADSLWSYPHSYMIAETVMNKPSFYVGQPVLTIFSGGQSWWAERHAVVFNFGGILRAYKRNGLPESQSVECEKMVFRNCEPLLIEIFQGKTGRTFSRLISFLRANWDFPEAWRALSRASLAAGKPRIYSLLYSWIRRLSKLAQRFRTSVRYRREQLWHKLFQD
jgi:glycosyltransferase involved in cell wall biosynthesis